MTQQFNPIHLREMKTYVHYKIVHNKFIAVLFITAKKWKNSKCSSADEW